MTRIPLTLAALAAFAAAAPAAAQYGQYGSRYNGYAYGDVDIDGLRAEIDAGVSSGAISGREAWSLRSQLRGLVNLQRQYAANGLSWSERNDLQQRALGLRNEIAQARGYASGYGGYGDRYDNGRYDPRYDNGRYDNRSGQYGYGSGYNRYNNGTYGNGYANRGYGSGQYSQYDRDRTYRDDRDDDDDYGVEANVALRVGDRAPDGLYGVPDEYRARFRDSPYFYYRYGAGNVYQIDARNGTVTRVIPVGR